MGTTVLEAVYYRGWFFLVNDVLLDLERIFASNASLQSVPFLFGRQVRLDEKLLFVCQVQDDTVCPSIGWNELKNELSLPFVSFDAFKSVRFSLYDSLVFCTLDFDLDVRGNTSHLRYS